MKTTDFETSHRPSFSFLKDLGALYTKGGLDACMGLFLKNKAEEADREVTYGDSEIMGTGRI